MKLKHHIVFSTVISGILYTIFKSWGLSIASFVTGIFIDLDHFIDYFIVHHGIHFNIKDFYHFFYKEKHKKITLLLHGWEFISILFVITVITDFNPWISGALIGYTHHMISDYFYSKTSIWTYSLAWRWKNKFDSKLLFPRNRGYNP